MGFMDKLKAGAEQAKDIAGAAAVQAKDLAGDAATRAKDEARELQQKRELGQAYTELGQTVYALWEQGDLTHPGLTSRAERVRARKEQLEQGAKADTADTAEGEAESVPSESDGDESPSAPPS